MVNGINVSDFGLLLSVLHMSDDEIDGRKRFQKKVCILKHKYNIPFRYEFTPLHYGPFSETLAVAIDTLVNMGYINEKAQNT